MDPLIGASIISAGSNLLGGLFGRKGQKDTNAANAGLAREQMDFQERMSNTTHQREAKDLEAAGLNRLLSMNHAGASTPVGSTAHMENPNREMGEKISNSARMAADIMLTRESAKTQQKTQKVLDSQEKLNDANTAKTIAETGGVISNPLIGRIPVSSALAYYDKLRFENRGLNEIHHKIRKAKGKKTFGVSGHW